MAYPSESERNDMFPNHIDLGREPPKDMPVPAGERTKEKKFYPRLYIDAVPGLEDLPKEGCILIEFKRKRLTIEDDDKAGVELEIRGLCLPESFEEDGTLEEDMAKFMSKDSADDSAEEEDAE